MAVNQLFRPSVLHQAKLLFRTTPFTTATARTVRTAGRIRPFRFQRPYSSTPPPQPKPNPTPNLNSPTASPSLSQRLKTLSKEYGWTALAVYLGLSALDFPFCFLAVRVLGTERIGRAEHAVLSGFWTAVGSVAPSWREAYEERRKVKKIEKEERETAERKEDEAAGLEPKKKGDASKWFTSMISDAKRS
jgi:hypothetical protein